MRDLVADVNDIFSYDLRIGTEIHNIGLPKLADGRAGRTFDLRFCSNVAGNEMNARYDLLRPTESDQVKITPTTEYRKIHFRQHDSVEKLLVCISALITDCLVMR
jgi:hypothetical protein